MKFSFIFFLLIFSGLALKAQTAPPLPACAGVNGNATMTITGATSFLLNDLAKFSGSESFSTITLTVTSNKAYRIYIAGEITAMPTSLTNTIIPVGTFTALSTLQGTGPNAAFPLNNLYQLLVQTSGDNSHTITINRNALNTFTQAPGNHMLYLHFYFCI